VERSTSRSFRTAGKMQFVVDWPKRSRKREEDCCSYERDLAGACNTLVVGDLTHIEEPQSG